MSDSSEGSEAKKSDEDDNELNDNDMVTETTLRSDLSYTSDLTDVLDDAKDDNKVDRFGEEEVPSKDEEGSVIVVPEEPMEKGHFTVWGVCIALSKGTLDERRMKRLREGFFALLNQTL